MKVSELGKGRTLVETNGRKFVIYFFSDVHFDSKYCDRKLLKEHLNQAKSEGAAIFFNGDLLDVMGTFKDPRSSPEQIRPEYIDFDSGQSYLDLITQDCFRFLEPYAENILGFGYGNHETNILKRHNHDPLRAIQSRINLVGGNAVLSQYKGFLFIRQKIGTNKRLSTIYHHHGYGGNAQRSKGILSADIDAKDVPFADVIVTGHNHQKYYYPMKSYALEHKTLKVKTKTQFHVRCGHYKDGSMAGMGWAVEKGFSPTALGGWRCEFWCRDMDNKDKMIIKLEDLQ